MFPPDGDKHWVPSTYLSGQNGKENCKMVGYHCIHEELMNFIKFNKLDSQAYSSKYWQIFRPVYSDQCPRRDAST